MFELEAHTDRCWSAREEVRNPTHKALEKARDVDTAKSTGQLYFQQQKEQH